MDFSTYCGHTKETDERRQNKRQGERRKDEIIYINYIVKAKKRKKQENVTTTI